MDAFTCSSGQTAARSIYRQRLPSTRVDVRRHSLEGSVLSAWRPTDWCVAGSLVTRLQLEEVLASPRLRRLRRGGGTQLHCPESDGFWLSSPMPIYLPRA